MYVLNPLLLAALTYSFPCRDLNSTLTLRVSSSEGRKNIGQSCEEDDEEVES